MNKQIKFIAIAFTFFSLIACNQEKKSNPANEKEFIEKNKQMKGLVEELLTKEQQDALKSDEVIKILKEGNVRFTNNDLTARNHSKQVRNSAYGQYPKAIVLSCIDSRVPVEDVFDKGIGDLFVARNAGNIINVDVLILVLGHEHCGAVKAAIDNVELGNITAMLEKIKPAVDDVVYEGERTSKNLDFVHMVCDSNVNNSIEQIRINSPILKEMEDKGEIKIVGAYYNMDTGKAEWLQ